jgi:hypothetical protein
MTAKINSLDKLLPEMEVDFRKGFPLKNPWGTISYRNINNNNNKGKVSHGNWFRRYTAYGCQIRNDG